MAISMPPQSAPRSNHPAKPIRGDDEDYVDYLGRCVEFWSQTPPAAPFGFELMECSATPRHWPEYNLADDDLYPGGCSRCVIDSQSEALRKWQCKAEHRRWMTWRATERFARWAYTMGLISGSVTSCNSCDTHPKLTRLYWRGRRTYVLGVQANHWRCLLKYRHVPSEHVGLGFCGKCLPCSTCGSTTAGHLPGCAEVS